MLIILLGKITSYYCSIYHKLTNIYFTYLKLLTKYLLSSIFFYYRANILMFSMSIRIIPRKAVPLLITTPEAMNVANEPSLKIWPSSFQLWTKKVYVVYFLKTIFPFFFNYFLSLDRKIHNKNFSWKWIRSVFHEYIFLCCWYTVYFYLYWKK